jgi:uncharacterized protein with von Willebrand factor type A (vWA) domain
VTVPSAPVDVPARGGDEVLLGFTRALRAAGLPVTQDRARSYLEAVAAVGIDDRAATCWAGRATLCASPDDVERHDRVFEEWFRPDLAAPTGRVHRRRSAPTVSLLPDTVDDHPDAAEDAAADPLRVAASATEILRHRDVATLDPRERARVSALFAALPVVPPVRAAARRTPHRRGDVDASRTLRASLRRMGEPARIHHRRRSERPRRVVLLIDVSGSMSGYADALLRLAHRYVTVARPGLVEVFSVGTRLTHLTRPLRLRDPDRAIAAAGAVVPDWSGGTRLGETLKAFQDRWGRRGTARGAVVVIFSDGWERGDATLLGDQVAGLQRLAHRVIWVNPNRGKPGYAPVQQGIAAVLPHVDALVAGHSLATFAELTEEVRRA